MCGTTEYMWAVRAAENDRILVLTESKVDALRCSNAITAIDTYVAREKPIVVMGAAK